MLKNSPASSPPNPSIALVARDLPLPDVGKQRQVITLVTTAEQEFSTEPWEGAKIFIPLEDVVREYQVVNVYPQSLLDLQNIAATYRELVKSAGVTSAGCVINFSAVPQLPGNLGQLFGYTVLLSVVQTGVDFEIRSHPYEPDSPGYLVTEDCAWKTKIEQKLGESFEVFFSRLFFIGH